MKKESLIQGRKLIKELNAITFCGLRGIKAGDLLSVNVWGASKWTMEQICSFPHLKVTEYKHKINGKNPETAFVFSNTYVKRKDQYAKFAAVENLFKRKLVITPSKVLKRENPYLYLIPIWFLQMSKLDYSEIIKRGLCYKLCEAMGHAMQIENIIKETGSIKKVVFFFDVSAIDSLLVQRLKRSGYITYALQHGIVNGSYNYIEYKCSHADYLLLWGKYSDRCAKWYGRKNNLVVGNINGLFDEESKVEGNAEGRRRFIVCTQGVLDKEDWEKNCCLIKMANQTAREMGAEYSLRAHPYDSADRYREQLDSAYCTHISKREENITDLFYSVDFTLCGNSTTFCDAIYRGLPAFRYITEKERQMDVCKGISFGRVDSYESLKAALTEMLQNKEAYRHRLAKVRELLFDPGNPAEKYKRAIEDT